MNVRRGYYKQATLRNEVLEEGQPFYEIDTNRMKIGGEGGTKYNDTPYIGSDAGSKVSLDYINHTIPKDTPPSAIENINTSIITSDSLIFISCATNNYTTRMRFYNMGLYAEQYEGNLQLMVNNPPTADIPLSIAILNVEKKQ